MTCKMVSLDTSSTETGYSVFINGAYLCSGVLVPDQTRDAQERMSSMCKKIIAFLKEEKPNIVVVERMNVGRNVKTARMLAEIIGVVYGWCLSKKAVSFTEIGPSQWRSSLNLQSKAKRDELKQMSQKYVEDTLGKKVSDNEADAICIGFGYIKFIERKME